MRVPAGTVAFVLAAGFGLMLASPSARAIAIIDITDDAVGSGVWGLDYTSGYEFEVGPGSLTFNALGLFDVQTATPILGPSNTVGLDFSHVVGVWDATGFLVTSATVDPGDPTEASSNTYGNWVYQSIAPVTLGAGTYRIGALFLGAQGQDEPRMVQQTAISNDPNVTYLRGMYTAGSTLSAPTLTFTRNDDQYFGPTMLSISVPDGGSLAVLALFSCAGLLGLKRRSGF